MKTIMKIRSLAALMVLATLLAGCNDADNTELPIDVQTESTDISFTEYSLFSGGSERGGWSNLDYEGGDYKGKILAINSYEELARYAQGTLPAIDFSKKTLIVAYGCSSGSGSGDEGIEFKKVSNRDYEMTAYGHASATLAMVYWHAAILVDKLPSDSRLKLETMIITGDGPQKGVNIPFTQYSLFNGVRERGSWSDLNYEGSDYKGNILVINSNEELAKYGGEAGLPAIDFSKKTLIVAYGYNSGNGFCDEIEFKKVSDRDYEMTAYGAGNLAAVMVPWHAAIVVDNIPSDSRLKLETVVTMLLH